MSAAATEVFLLDNGQRQLIGRADVVILGDGSILPAHSSHRVVRLHDPLVLSNVQVQAMGKVAYITQMNTIHTLGMTPVYNVVLSGWALADEALVSKYEAELKMFKEHYEERSKAVQVERGKISLA